MFSWGIRPKRPAEATPLAKRVAKSFTGAFKDE